MQRAHSIQSVPSSEMGDSAAHLSRARKAGSADDLRSTAAPLQQQGGQLESPCLLAASKFFSEPLNDKQVGLAVSTPHSILLCAAVSNTVCKKFRTRQSMGEQSLRLPLLRQLQMLQTPHSNREEGIPGIAVMPKLDDCQTVLHNLFAGC